MSSDEMDFDTMPTTGPRTGDTDAAEDQAPSDQVAAALPAAELGDGNTQAPAAAAVVADDEPATVRLVMTARAPRWIGPPITTGKYLFVPGVPLPVQPDDVAQLTGHAGLAELGVTFAVASADGAAPAEEPQPTKRRKQRG